MAESDPESQPSDKSDETIQNLKKKEECKSSIQPRIEEPEKSKPPEKKGPLAFIRALFTRKKGKHNSDQDVNQEEEEERPDAPEIKETQIKRKKKTESRILRRGKSKSKETFASEVSDEKPLLRTAIIAAPISPFWKLIRGFVKDSLNRGSKGIFEEFRKMERVTKLDEATMPQFKEFFRQNKLKPARNRYKDVGCLDRTRIVIYGAHSQHYIHANFVETPQNPRRFICTQAPMDCTILDFWRMIVQEESAAIIMLCNMTEQGKSKCASYLPVLNNTLDFGEIKVRYVSDEIWSPDEVNTKNVQIIKTELRIHVAGRAAPHNCTHFHWKDWPDRGVPDVPKLEPIHLLNEATKLGPKPIVVHCSAGVGRTGAIVLIQYALELVEINKEALAGFATLLANLREQRFNSVQTEHQYLFVHFVMLKYFQMKGYIPGEYKSKLDKFTADYREAIKGFDK